MSPKDTTNIESLIQREGLLTLRVVQSITLFLPFVMLFCGVLTESSSAYAEPLPPPLNENMSVPEVIRLWGPAKDKTQNEVSHREIWHYANHSVTFVNGKVTDFHVMNPKNPSQEIRSLNHTALKMPLPIEKTRSVRRPEVLDRDSDEPMFLNHRGRERAKDLSGQDITDIFSQIAKEGGKEGGSESGSPPPPGGIPPMIPGRPVMDMNS